MVTRFVRGAVFAVATDPASDKATQTIEVGFSRRTGLNRGFLNLPSPCKLTGWGSSDSISSKLSEFGVLYLCRMRPSDLTLLLESKLASGSQVAQQRGINAIST